MRNRTVQRFCAAALTCALLSAAGTASASTVLATFDNHPAPAPTDIYGSWSTATLTSGATSYNVLAPSGGFGGQWNGLGDGVDASGETDIELTVTVNASDVLTGLGVVLAMVDGDGTEWQYVINGLENSWFGLQPGTHILTVPVLGATGLINPGTTNGLDLANIIGFHTQVDTGGSVEPYDISFENIRLFVPGEAIEGDLDEDGFVGISDLNIVLGEWNNSVPPGDARADPSGDGFVGIADLNTVLGNWNAGTAPTTGSAVPEPASMAILGLGGLAAVTRRR